MRVLNKNDIDSILNPTINQYPFVFQPGFINYQNHYGNRVLFFEENEIVLAVLLFKKKIFKIGQIVFPPFRLISEITINEEKTFTNNFIEYVKINKIYDQLIAPLHNGVFKYSPPQSVNCKFGSLFIDLLPTDNELFNNINSSYKRQIKNSLKETDLTIKEGNTEFIHFYNLYKETHIRQNAIYETHERLKIIYESLSPTNTKCYVIYYNNIPQASALIFYSGKISHYIYGGSIANPFIGSVKLLHWKIINDMKQIGCSKYIMGGERLANIDNSKFDGIQTFKKRMGCKSEIGELWKIKINPFKCNIYNILLFIKNIIFHKSIRLPKDAIDNENMLNGK